MQTRRVRNAIVTLPLRYPHADDFEIAVPFIRHTCQLWQRRPARRRCIIVATTASLHGVPFWHMIVLITLRLPMRRMDRGDYYLKSC